VLHADVVIVLRQGLESCHAVDAGHGGPCLLSMSLKHMLVKLESISKLKSTHCTFKSVILFNMSEVVIEASDYILTFWASSVNFDVSLVD